MIDRAIGIFGIALALLTATAQYYIQVPNWIVRIGFCAGIFFCGLSLGLIAAGGLRQKRRVRPSALLRLHVFGDHRTPNRLNQENIFRWYYLQFMTNRVAHQGNQRIATYATLLFVIFEEDVVINTLSVHSPDIQLPIYEVNEFNQRYAIIYFSNNIPAGTLEVAVRAD